MKSTGVVRRIDELGRIVIPKEIRRNLRIKDGEALEIFVDSDLIGLKKFSPMNDLESIAKALVDSVYLSIKQDMIITDRDKIIAASMELKKKYLGLTISSALENYIDNRQGIVKRVDYEINLAEGKNEICPLVINPIVVNGDCIGLVIMLALEKPLEEFDEKIAEIITQFISKNIED